MPIKKYTYKKSTQRFHFWDESNRLCSTVVDGGKLIHNIYDASGERTLKAHSEYQGVFENGTPTDGGATLESYTTYPSAYMTIARNAVYTKHYFAGTQRVASKPAGSATRFNVYTFQEYEVLKNKQLGDAQAVADSVDLGELALRDTNPGTIVLSVYYFHPDHLGSSTVITDGAGYAYQIFLNLPFGETMAEQRRSGSLDNMYKFNGKELDSETGLYYYSARYYDPRISLFISVDPLAEMTMTPYQYTYQNPINLVDPTGMAAETWPPKDGKEGQTWKDSDGNFKFMNGRWYRDGGIFREMLTGERYASVGGGGGNLNYEGKELLSSSTYDYSYEIMPGKQSDDIKYIKNGKSGNQVSRYLQILK